MVHNGSMESTLGGIRDYLQSFYQERNSSSDVYVGSALSGFHDFYEQGNVRSSYGRLPEYGGLTLATSFAQASSHQPNFLQVVTWNDFGEGTEFEPVAPTDSTSPFERLLELQGHILGKQDEAAFKHVYDQYVADAGIPSTYRRDVNLGNIRFEMCRQGGDNSSPKPSPTPSPIGSEQD